MPRPERHVFVCVQNRGPGHPRGSCAQNGSAAVYEEFLHEFQQRNLFGRFLLTTCGCVGPCGQGPNVLVYPDGVMYGGVTPQDVPALIDRHLLGGEPVEPLRLPADLW